MAEPISIVSSAAGFISLSLDLCKGLKSYVSAYLVYEEDAKNVVEKLEGLQYSLALLGNALQTIEPSIPTDNHEIRQQLENQCRVGLSRLQQYLKRCGAKTNEASTSTASTPTPATKSTSALHKRRDRAIKRFIYPLRKPTLTEIGDTVDKIRERVQFLLDILNLVLQNVSLQRHTSTKTLVRSQNSDLQQVRSDIGEMNRRMERIVSKSRMLRDIGEQNQLETQTLIEAQNNKLQKLQVDIQRMDRRLGRAQPLARSPKTDGNAVEMSLIIAGFSRVCEYLLLQYSMARHWNVFEAYLRTVFGQRPGERFVKVKQYQLLRSRQNAFDLNLPKNEVGWYKELPPGAKFVMSLQTAADDTQSVGLTTCPRCQRYLDSKGRDGSIELVECTRDADEQKPLDDLLYLESSEVRLFKRMHLSERTTTAEADGPLGSISDEINETCQCELETNRTTIHINKLLKVREKNYDARVIDEDLKERFGIEGRCQSRKLKVICMVVRVLRRGHYIDVHR
ncbi:hypothetical protein B0H63DRAFT_514019 [Podospora didyma]|uniref:Ubiquitin-like domain-containing protein n=1 Tax=Podospora didyma TaxID=330526 RepID=A0AAE0N738_9PEZI|nr:hypothetical protein B0H63DRAFT_514019 [Podospora didyma]